MTLAYAHLQIIGYDDWYALYKDGKLGSQGHSVPIFEIVQAAGGNPVTIEEIDVDEAGIYAFFENVGHFPENYYDIPLEVFA
jgi:hypothetical protein